MAKKQVDGNSLKAIFGAGVLNVSNNVNLINELNVFPVPDGDTGVNLYHTLQRAWAEIEQLDNDSVSAVAKRFAYGALMGARGNSGTIMSQLLTGFADGLGQAEELTAPLLLQACQSAVARAYAAVSQPVEGTILTVAKEAREAIPAALSLDDVRDALIAGAEASLENTPNLLPILKDAGVVDAGGMGLLCFLRGIQQHNCAVTGALLPPVLTQYKQPTPLPSPGESYGYDVQFIMLGENLDLVSVRREMERLGWSVIVVGDASTIKVHIHVDNPALPLDYALKSGANLTDVVIENMQLQAIDFATQHERRIQNAREAPVAVVAVAGGEGMQAIFRELNCATIITRDVLTNPSTEEIIQAIERTLSENVIILPNHKDIVQAAKLAASLHSEQQVHIVPSTNMLQGISAMIAYGDAQDNHVDIESIATAMRAACDNVISIQITRATRSARLNGLDIKKHEFLAIVDDAIRVAATTIERALCQALMLVGANEKELVTLYCGADFDLASARPLIESLSTQLDDIEFETVYGGQARYPLLVSVE